MSAPGPRPPDALPWSSPILRYEQEAAGLDLADGRPVTARRYAFDTWADLVAFAQAAPHHPEVRDFETAVESIVGGGLATLRSMLERDPRLARARSRRRHHATLLHYVAANGVEAGRQRTPPNSVAIARALLAAGAEADALADLYDAPCTTMSLLVSSTPPAEAGLQAALVETLLDHGAAFEGPAPGRSALLTALAFGFLDTARVLVKRGAPVKGLAEVAGLGRLDDATRLLPGADAVARHAALALAAQHGHAEVVALLLDAGEDPNRLNPEGYHPHSTPLHQAAWSDHLEVVRLLVDRGARLDIRDTIYDGTPLDWAIHGGRTRIADCLRGRTPRSQ